MNEEEYSNVLGFCTRCQKSLFNEEAIKIYQECIGQVNTIVMKDESNKFWQRIKLEVLKVE